MNEFELIRRYFAGAASAREVPGIVQGIGDDCALLELPADWQLAVSTDTLVAGVHFPDPCSEPYGLGQRALAVSASDLAAMGAEPMGFTLALTLPEVDDQWLAAFSAGLDAMAVSCGLALIGGDTTRGPLSMTLTVMGRVPRGAALRRDGARPGDLLCVGGSLGDAAGALPWILGQRPVDSDAARQLMSRYWAPEPQFALGRQLRGRASSGMDISDGLLADCGHIAAASSVALVIEADCLPASTALKQLYSDADALAAMLAGGDDYRLVFTLPARELHSLHQAQPQVAVIGRVEAGNGVRVLDAAGADVTPAIRGYEHFVQHS